MASSTQKFWIMTHYWWTIYTKWITKELFIEIVNNWKRRSFQQWSSVHHSVSLTDLVENVKLVTISLQWQPRNNKSSYTENSGSYLEPWSRRWNQPRRWMLMKFDDLFPPTLPASSSNTVTPTFRYNSLVISSMSDVVSSVATGGSDTDGTTWMDFISFCRSILTEKYIMLKFQKIESTTKLFKERVCNHFYSYSEKAERVPNSHTQYKTRKNAKTSVVNGRTMATTFHLTVVFDSRRARSKLQKNNSNICTIYIGSPASNWSKSRS